MTSIIFYNSKPNSPLMDATWKLVQRFEWRHSSIKQNLANSSHGTAQILMLIRRAFYSFLKSHISFKNRIKNTLFDIKGARKSNQGQIGTQEVPLLKPQQMIRLLSSHLSSLQLTLSLLPCLSQKLTLWKCTLLGLATDKMLLRKIKGPTTVWKALFPHLRQQQYSSPNSWTSKRGSISHPKTIIHSVVASAS